MPYIRLGNDCLGGDLDCDLDLEGLLTLGLGVGIITLLPWVLPHPDDLSHVHCGLVLSFM